LLDSLLQEDFRFKKCDATDVTDAVILISAA